MVSGFQKSRTLRRTKVKTPGGRVAKRYSPRKPSYVTCPQDNIPLHGVPRARANGISKLSKSQRRPSRPFGGVLSSGASRKLIIKQARAKN